MRRGRSTEVGGVEGEGSAEASVLQVLQRTARGAPATKFVVRGPSELSPMSAALVVRGPGGHAPKRLVVRGPDEHAPKLVVRGPSEHASK